MEKIMKKIEDYVIDFDCICKYVLIYGADEEKMQENADKLDALAEKVELYCKIVELGGGSSDIKDKQSYLERLDNFRDDMVELAEKIRRFIDTDTFTDYFKVVKMCVNELR